MASTLRASWCLTAGPGASPPSDSAPPKAGAPSFSVFSWLAGWLGSLSGGSSGRNSSLPYSKDAGELSVRGLSRVSRAIVSARAGTTAAGISLRAEAPSAGGASLAGGSSWRAGRAALPVVLVRRRSRVTFSIRRWEIPRKVSNTPLPWVATASKVWTSRSGLSSASSCSMV